MDRKCEPFKLFMNYHVHNNLNTRYVFQIVLIKFLWSWREMDIYLFQ